LSGDKLPSTNNKRWGNVVTTRTIAPLSAILIAAFLNTILNAPAAAATNVAFANFQGAWVATTTYNPGDVVTYMGSSYICLVQNLHHFPTTNHVDWALMDPPGATGATGPQGPQGIPGPAGPPGPAGSGASLALVDANGVLIGPYDPFGQAAVITTGGRTISLGVLSATGAGDETELAFFDAQASDGTGTFYHTAKDCSDPRLFLLNTPIAQGLLWGGVLYVPSTTGLVSASSIVAVEVIEGGQSFSQPGPCNNTGSGLKGAPVVTAPLPNVVAPFSIQVR
jgi:hypothetical protein